MPNRKDNGARGFWFAIGLIWATSCLTIGAFVTALGFGWTH